ncbi:MAG: TraB/GumN family protein [Rhizomicrobium sp.]
MRWRDVMRAVCLFLLSIAPLSTLTATASFAQAPPPQSTDWSVEEVTVTAQSTGPAYWHATRGQSEVWILGVVDPIPKDFVWNQNHLAKLLDGTRLVLLPPRASATLFQSAWFLLTERSLLSLQDGKTLDGVLGAPLAARFTVARGVVHRDADRYDGDAPALVALKLEGDFLKANAMTLDEPADTIESLARRHDVEVRHIATYDAMPSIEAVLKSPPETSRACVEAAINDVEFENEHAAAAADAWAIGNVAGVKTHYSESNVFECLLALAPVASELEKRSIADTVGAIEAALGEGGRTIAVVGIGQLLRKNGVLERLHADGIAVEGPPQ